VVGVHAADSYCKKVVEIHLPQALASFGVGDVAGGDRYVGVKVSSMMC